ncbi:MAG: ABC transporter ATP-binding protein [Dictyoglomus sp. NZ13-RE01]|nr:MAG: ABC transporter ATP-binding protein [Dictyoglomus sp. NZ13-RE01]
MEIFRVENVWYYYLDHRPALSSINLRINKGERVCLLGPNGAGKTTLLKILDGLLYPKEGKVFAFSKEIREETFNDKEFNKFFRKNVVMLFQNVDAQLFSPTVRDEIAFGLIQLDFSLEEIEEKVRKISEFFNISHLLDRSPFQLSEGEKKKVALASLLVIEPEVILLDEPTNGLDPRSARDLINLIKRLQEEGKTFVISTHDLKLVEELAEKIYVLGEDKRLIREGGKEILKDKEFLANANLI